MSLAKAVGREIPILTLLLSPVLVGLLYMAAFSAPMGYIVGNAVGGLVMFVGILLGPRARSLQIPTIALIVISVVILALIAATFAGHSVDGARRWLKLGPFNLHAGMLLLPTLVILLPGLDARLACGVTLCAAALFAIQPDFASALALCLISFVIFVFTRERWTLLGFLGASVALAFTMLQNAVIASVPFVEDVVQDAAARYPLISIGMIASIAMALTAPILALSKEPTSMPARNWTLSACLLGYFLASLIGDFPTPLLGYGLSPIFGFGFACILLMCIENSESLVSSSPKDINSVGSI